MQEIIKVFNPNTTDQFIWYFCKACRQGLRDWNHQHSQDLVAIPGKVKYIVLFVAGNNLVVGKEWRGWKDELLKGGI